MRRNVPSENNFEPIIWATNHWSIYCSLYFYL